MDYQPEIERHQQPGGEQPAAPRLPRRFGWRLITRQRFVWQTTLVAGSVAIGLMVVLWFVFHAQGRQSILHYTTLSGIDRVGDWRWSFLYPGVLLGFALLNFLFASVNRSATTFSQWLLAGTTLFLTGLLTFATTLLLMINRSA